MNYAKPPLNGWAFGMYYGREKEKIKIIITKKKLIKLKKYNQYLRMYLVDINQKWTPT